MQNATSILSSNTIGADCAQASRWHRPHQRTSHADRPFQVPASDHDHLRGGGPGTSDGSADRGDGGACLGDLGTPSCGALGDGGADGGADSGADCQLSCVQALTNLRPAVADQAGKCLLGLPTCEGGGPDVVACFDEAVAKACPAPDAPAFCARLESLCVDAGAPDAGAEASAKCGAIASALNATGRTTLESCVIESGCALSFDTCVAQLK